MYKVVVVEDDRVIRKAIIQSDWKSIDAGVVGEASNGEDALIIIEETQPDLIITDIDMPFMNGIALAKKVREIFEETRIIFLTGYDDFEYLHEALLMKSDDYLLKPVEMTVLLAKAEKALKSWVKDNKKKDQLSKSIPFVQEQFITRLLFDRYELSQESVINELQRLNITLHTPSFVVMNLTSQNHINKLSLFEWLRQSGILKECTLLHYQIDEVFIIVPIDELKYKLADYKKRIESWIQINQEYDLIAAHSKTYSALTDLKTAFMEAKINLEIKLTTHKNGDKLDNLSLDEQSEEIIRIDSFMHLLEMKTFNLIELKKMGINLVTYISSMFNQLISNREEVINVYDEGEKIMRAESYHELHAVINPLVVKWKREYERRQYYAQSDSLIKRATTYVNENYNDPDLSLTKLADEIHVTAPYLSNLFKSELHMNFTTYLLNLKMEKAKELLEKSDLKTYEIASHVGYTNSHYFSSSFKKYTGKTPTNYRREHETY